AAAVDVVQALAFDVHERAARRKRRLDPRLGIGRKGDEPGDEQHQKNENRNEDGHERRTSSSSTFQYDTGARRSSSATIFASRPTSTRAARRSTASTMISPALSGGMVRSL